MRSVSARRSVQVIALSMSALLCFGVVAYAEPTPTGPTSTGPTSTGPTSTGPTRSAPSTLARAPGLGAEEIDPVWEFRSRVNATGPADHLAVDLENKKTGQLIRKTSPDTPDWACPTGVWILRMTRQLNNVSSGIFPLCSESDAAALEARLKVANEKEQDGNGRDHNEMVVVNSINRAPGGKSLTLRALPAALGRIGVAGGDFATLDLSVTAFSAWGVPGLSPGQGYAYRAPVAADRATPVEESSPAGIKGGFLKDSQDNFALEASDFRVYDLDPERGITLNHRRYPVPVKPAGFTGGFHVVVFDSRTLEVKTDDLYSTRDDADGLVGFGTAMARLADTPDPSVLVMIASVGTPAADPRFAGPDNDLPENCTGGAAFVVTCRFTPTDENEHGTEQVFTVPEGSRPTELRVTLQGGHGGGANHGGVGGKPARVSAVLPVDGQKIRWGSQLFVEVGGDGVNGANSGAGVGGFNGGGMGASSTQTITGGWPGGGGGGASDIRFGSIREGVAGSLKTRLAIAGGGGGAGGDSYYEGPGGDGGQAGGDGTSGRPGTDGQIAGGGGGQTGTATAGGEGGYGAWHGMSGQLGIGGGGSRSEHSAGAGGGGGGGLFGGGRGGINDNNRTGGGGGGGGGGSSLVPSRGSISSVAVDEPAFVEINYRSVMGTLADTLRPFGATPTVIQALTTYPRYALVGRPASPAERAVGLSPDSPEASGLIYAGATGRLQGVLQPGHDGEFASITSFAPFKPTSGDSEKPEVTANYDLYDVRSNVDEEWSVPAEGNAAQAAAMRYLSQKACHCDDIRDYYKAQEETLGQWTATIRSLDYAAAAAETPAPAFDEPSFTVVRAALLSELADAILVHGMSLKSETLLTQQNLFASQALKNVYEQIRKSLEPTEDAKLTESVTALLLEIIGISAEILGQGGIVGPIVGVISAQFKFGMELANDENGNDYDALGSTVEELENDLEKQFTDSLTTQSQMYSEIYANQGKLRAVADGLRNHAPAWDLQLQNAGRLVDAANTATTLSFWRALVGVSFQRYEAKGAPTDDLDNWCIGKNAVGNCHMAGTGKNGQNKSYGGFVLGKNTYSYKTLAPGLKFAEGWDNLMVATPQNDNSAIRAMSPALMNGDAGNGKEVNGLTLASITRSGGYAPYVLLRWPMVTGKVCPQTVSVSGFRFYGTGSHMDCATSNLSAPPPTPPKPPLKITTKALPSGKVGKAYAVQLQTNDAAATRSKAQSTQTWSVAPGSKLPAGITLSAKGRLAGRPTTKGSYGFKVTVHRTAGTAVSGDVASKRLTMRIAGARPASDPAPSTGTGSAPASNPPPSRWTRGELADTGGPNNAPLLLGLALLLAGSALLVRRR